MNALRRGQSSLKAFELFPLYHELQYKYRVMVQVVEHSILKAVIHNFNMSTHNTEGDRLTSAYLSY